MGKVEKTRVTKTRTQRLYQIHLYYQRTGFYPFLIQTTLKVILGISLLVALLLSIEHYVISLDELMGIMIDNFPSWATLSVFFIAESILGLLPPDLFIVWSGKFNHPWMMLTVVGTVSMAGGIMAYILGRWLLHWPPVKKYVETKFAKYVVMLNKWGAVLVFLAALFPLPYGAVCTLAGLVNFPPKVFLLVNITRYLRFYLYALILFNVV